MSIISNLTSKLHLEATTKKNPSTEIAIPQPPPYLWPFNYTSRICEIEKFARHYHLSKSIAMGGKRLLFMPKLQNLLSILRGI